MYHKPIFFIHIKLPISKRVTEIKQLLQWN